MSSSPQPTIGHDAPRARESFWKKLAGLQTHDRRHDYPRVHGNVPVRFSGTPGGHIDLTTNDLSKGGLQVACDRRTASRLRPGDSDQSMPAYGITLLLNVEGRRLRVNGQARVVHVTQVPEAPPGEAMAVGVQFVKFESGGDVALMRFIEQHLYPAGL